MNAFCHKLLTKLHITKHTTLVESCSEEFLPIVTPINKKDLQRPQQQLDNQCRQMLFKETSPPRAEPTSCERQPTLPQYKFESLQRYQQATTARNGNQHCDNSTDGKGHNTTSCNGGATVTTAAATSATTINPNRLSASKNLQEFDFTLYDLNGHGRVTKDDIAGLVRTIYERIGCKIDLPRGGERRIRVKLEIVVDDRPTLNANEQEVAHQEISRTRHRSPIRVAFDEEQLLYETIKQQYQQQHPMTDLRSSQKCNHQSPGNAHARTAKKVLTSEALRVRHSVPLSTPCTFVRTGGANHHPKAQTPFYSAANISSMTATASTPLVTSHSVYTTVATQPFCVTTAVNCTDTASTAAVVEHSQVGCHIGGNILSSTSPHSPHSHSNEQYHYASSKKQHHYRRRRQHHLGGERTELNNVAKSQEKPDRPPSHGGRLREKPFVLKSPYDEETIPVSKSRHHGHRHHHHHHQQLIRHVHHHYHHVA